MKTLFSHCCELKVAHDAFEAFTVAVGIGLVEVVVINKYQMISLYNINALIAFHHQR